MSILIKGMEMPQSCWRCPLCLTVDPDTYRCIPTGQDFESTFDAIDHIVLSCPLVEVPPHGRLIDADALMKDGWKLFKQVGSSVHEMPLNNPSIPIIIEAEVDDG